MASGKEMKAIISLAGKVDPSLAKAIKSVDRQFKAMEGVKKIGSAMATVGKVAAKGLAVAGSAAVTAATAIGGAALKSYSQYEQLVGGVDTLFKGSSATVQQYAAEAYKTAGVSANTYMEQATAFSASLIQSLGGDTQAAASYADLAIKDMSDNANKMGTDIGSIQQTYQSLMRGNYAMLDNLKLGYGGTKSELERLVKDASKLTGKALDPSKFSDVIEAIHAVQENMGITGTTAKEAATTIEGSVNTMKAAWSNWLTGLGREDADMGALTDQLLESLGNVANNVGPVVKRIAQSLAKALPGALAGALNAVGGAIGDVLGIQLPTVDAGQVSALIQSFVTPLQRMMQTVGPYLASFAQTVVPPLVDALQTLVPLLANIVEAVLPPLASLLGPIISAVLQIVQAVLPPLSAAISSLTPVIMQVVNAILPPLVSLLNQIMPVISQIAAFVGQVLVTAINALTPVIQTLTPIVSAIFGVASSLLNSVIIPILSPIMQLAQSLLPALSSAWQMLQGPIEFITGVFGGILDVVNSIVGAIGDLIGKIGEAASALANSPLGQAAGFVGGLLGFARGGFTSGPYIAGEDPRYPNEAVISFNPAYRAQNLRYWQMAGHMLGAYSAKSAPVTAAVSGGGGTVIDLSGITYSPKVEVRGNASREDIVAALRRDREEFADFLEEVVASRMEAAYA